MAYLVERSAEWMHWIAPEEFNDEDLVRIVTFFVFYSPCKHLSSMGRSLQEYGWNTPWRKPFYLNKQLKNASSNFNLIYSASTYDNLHIALEKSNLNNDFYNELSVERICIYDKMSNQFMSVFYHLRNCFAHCRLNMVDINGECVFILEDGVPVRNNPNAMKLSARMILRKSTLLKWIEIIESGEKEYKGTQGTVL